GPEVLDRSATTADDHDIHARNETDEVEAAPQVSRSIVTLHPRWPDDDVRVAVAAGQYCQAGARGRAVQRRPRADPPGQRGPRPRRRSASASSPGTRDGRMTMCALG